MDQVELPAVGGLEAGAVLTTLVNHATPGSESVTLEPRAGNVADNATGTHRRLLTLGGAPTAITVLIHPGGVTLRAPAPVLDEATDVVTWWFDLTTDPGPVAARLSLDPRLAPLVSQRPALRPLRHPAGFEAAIDTVVGQQVTLSSARLFGERLRAAYSPGAVEGLRIFPSADTLVRAPLEELRAAVGLTTSRARTVQAVAQLFADGFHLTPEADPTSARAHLLGVPGVGPWTVEYLALRALGDPDAFPSSDAVVRRALDGAPAPQAQREAETWRPHRAWATAHLWAGQTVG
ncbi:DNA-3-methyladenine glycosylase family protein [Ornithinimicrobium faecis]|uniref:DNA-3-methyladenine glycosylase II n=1 Tax=Ornithinimicrobium faecis TaxID=2934158 RepID=A0ABY4YSZ9_9MICO|nr:MULTISPECIES: AlkA N-terminal domain-containing protein [unclassified Ornithinimicrobium]USQ79488.1 3-methyladenine DNA glycosylase 2 [Ornithinimicrobium sp. HY1793]